MRAFFFTVKVETETWEQAQLVMNERIGYDEEVDGVDNYLINLVPNRMLPTLDTVAAAISEVRKNIEAGTRMRWHSDALLAIEAVTNRIADELGETLSEGRSTRNRFRQIATTDDWERLV